MTRIDFYVLSTHDPQQRRVTACRLVEKAYRQGLPLYLKTASEEDTRVFDDLLWTFRQGSFVPHERVDSADREAPVIIGHQAPPPECRGVLVNLGAEVPAGWQQFERVAELVDQDEQVRHAGRQRYKHYQSEGHAIQTHTL